MANRRTLLVFLFVAMAVGPARAQFGVGWTRVPSIVVVSSGADARLDLVDEAIAYWNARLEDAGSAFRLGPATRAVQPVPEEALLALSQSVVGPLARFRIPSALQELPGELTIVLGDSDFISFAGPFDARGRRVVGIRGANVPPMTLPNVARNVITHEIGHALGLGHNGDPAMLMCGRPAACRPNAFASREPRIFPLTDEERQQLRTLYPPDWKPRPRSP